MKAASAPLLAHTELFGTTTCRLLKIRTKAGVCFGLTNLDQDRTYDDGSGDGAINYIATNGFDPETFSADAGYQVSTSRAQALISDVIPGVTEAMIDAGDLEEARWWCYHVNYMDLTQGHLMLDSGDLGRVTVDHGVMWLPELNSLVTRLKSPIGFVWSIRGRCIFGTPADAQTGCGIDTTPLWVNGSVSSVGAETNRVFTGTNVEDGGPNPFPGRLQWLTGPNAGREYATESVAGLVVTLGETTNYPITNGNTYRLRADCGKRYIEDCIGVWNNGPNFKGEPKIPVGDSAEVLTPQAQVPKKQKMKAG